jgi:hypothetical protein
MLNWSLEYSKLGIPLIFLSSLIFLILFFYIFFRTQTLVQIFSFFTNSKNQNSIGLLQNLIIDLQKKNFFFLKLSFFFKNIFKIPFELFFSILGSFIVFIYTLVL